MQDRLDAIAERFGRYVTADLSVRLDPAIGADWVRAIEASPPAEVGGRAVVSVSSYPEANLVRLVVDGGMRLQIRPSGTEPKVKLYGEAVDVDHAVLAALLTALAASAPYLIGSAFGSFGAGAGTNRGSFGVGAGTNQVVRGWGEFGDQVELGADLGAGHRPVGAHRGQRGFHVDAEQQQHRDGGGAGAADAGGAVHDEHLAVPQTPRQVVEERPVDVEIGRAQVVDREPDRTAAPRRSSSEPTARSSSHVTYRG